MRTGDADATIWLEGAKGRSYCLSVSSQRRGRFESKLWQTPVYRWSLELWVGEDEITRQLARGTTTTFAAAMRIVRREAEQLEREARS